jgi:hypothetical protein
LNKNNSKIIWKDYNGKKKLFTIIPKPENQKNQYRNWNPFYSKLSAALFNGLEVFPFRNNSKIFFLEESRTTTLTHIHDLVDSSSQIISHKLNEKNLEINYADKNGIESFDVMYFDLGTIKNPIAKIVDYQKLLKKFGFLIIVLNSLENEIISSKELPNWWDIKNESEKQKIFQDMGISLNKDETKTMLLSKFIKFSKVWQDNIALNMSKNNYLVIKNQINLLNNNNAFSFKLVEEVNLSNFFESTLFIFQKN